MVSGEPSDHLAVLQRQHPLIVPAPAPAPLPLLEQRRRPRRPRGRNVILTLRPLLLLLLLLLPCLVVEVRAAIPAALGAAGAVRRESQRVRLLVAVVGMLMVELLHRDGRSPAHDVVIPAEDRTPKNTKLAFTITPTTKQIKSYSAPRVDRSLVKVVPPRVHDLHVDVLVAPLLARADLLSAARRSGRRGEIRQQRPLRSLHRAPESRPRPLVPSSGRGRHLSLVPDPRHGVRVDVRGAVRAQEGGRRLH